MTDITHANREARAQEALGIIYAHHVIKYDPDAAERMMTNALDTARIAALDEAIAVFDEDLAAQAARLGIKPRVVQSPAQWAARVRRAALEALKGWA